MAGAVTALSVYLLFGALGVALGLSVQDRVTETQLGVGVAIWGVLTLLIALFLGGWVTSQCTVGENKSEAVIYGVILWGVVFTMLLWQVFQNIAMTVGLMPITGLPLPFISYGGSGIVTFFALIGLVQNVHMRRYR